MLKRLTQTTLLVVFALTMLGAGTPSTRFDQLGHKLMCPCGCAEILLECNHVGCPDSDGMRAELHTQVASGASDPGILNFFATKYGATVLAAPIRGGFDNVAWIVPFAVLLLGVLGIVLLLRLRHIRHTPLAASAPTSPADDAIRDRIRSETRYGD